MVDAIFLPPKEAQRKVRQSHGRVVEKKLRVFALTRENWF